MATIKTKYDLGQLVWVIVESHMRRLVRCETCSHTGRVVIGGQEFVCPNCNGKSRSLQYAGHKWHIEVSGHVGKITAEVYKDPPPYERELRDGIKCTYMLDSTGVGSGNLWAEDKLFPSKDEAQAECDRRNAGVHWADDPPGTSYVPAELGDRW